MEWRRAGAQSLNCSHAKSKLFIGLDPSDGQEGHGDVLLRPLEREAGWGPSSCSPCCWGRAHLGCIQGILGDVVL